jgi:hypothetical protein
MRASAPFWDGVFAGCAAGWKYLREGVERGIYLMILRSGKAFARCTPKRVGNRALAILSVAIAWHAAIAEGGRQPAIAGFRS